MPRASGGVPLRRAAPSDLDRFRAEDRSWLRERRSARPLLRRSLAPLAARLRLIRTCRVAARLWSSSVTDAHGISPWRQFASMVVLGLRHDLPPEAYYRYRIFRPELAAVGGQFIGWEQHDRMLGRLITGYARDEVAVLEDKARFATWCREQGLEHVPVWAEVGPDDVASPLALPEGDVVLKPAGGRGGVGVEIWTRESGLLRGPDGRLLEEADFRAMVLERAREGAWLIQSRLANLPELSRLSPGALMTFRVITGRPPDGPPEVLLVALGIPLSGTAAVDNLHAGAIAASVDVGSGVLSAGARVAAGDAVTVYHHHPETGERITGRSVPGVTAAVDLALRAHRCTTTVAFVGWDVVPTADGACLLEANLAWNAGIQTATSTPLGATQYVPWTLEHLAHMRR